MNIVLLQPTDVLFFRDGRPMEGSLAGHGAAWPLPNVIDAAIHAALHRSDLKGHPHDQVDRNGKRTKTGARCFGSLVSAGPFPVLVSRGGKELDSPVWFLPRPADLQDSTLAPGLLPTGTFDSVQSSLPDPLEYAVASQIAPSKESGTRDWLSLAAYQRYLDGGIANLDVGEAFNDSEIGDFEHTIGIGIDPETQTTGQGEAAGKIYSARYLRLREDWRMGVIAATAEKRNGNSHDRADLISELFKAPGQILVGGQQRCCTASLVANPQTIPLPAGKSAGFKEKDGRFLVKWVLLTPAIWPAIPEGASKRGTQRNQHCGGWLPNWIDPMSGDVLLQMVGKEERRRRRSLNYAGEGYQSGENARPIKAKLVGAVVPKPLIVTGYALPNKAAENPDGGAKSTHLAVAAGAVYYFEADSAQDAGALANALNWHGSTEGTEIKNRRSTLMGEKGFGLGVCGTWNFYQR